MNRAERRAQAKAVPAYRRGIGAEELIRQMSRNGITPEQYDEHGREEYERGLRQGYMDGGTESIKMVYAAVCLAVRELHGWGKKRCYDLLARIDEHVTNHLHSSDAIEEVFREVGLTIDFKDPLERVKEVEE